MQPGYSNSTHELVARRAAQAVTRTAMAVLLSHFERRPVAEIVKSRWGDDRKQVDLITRAATSPTTSVNHPLAGLGIAPDLLALLAPASAAANLFGYGLQFGPFDGVASQMVPGIATDANAAAFIAQGGPFPVRQISTTGGCLLQPRKLGAIVAFTHEMLVGSTPNIEAVVRAAVAEGIGLALDAKATDATVGDDTRPAGLRYNVNAGTASTSTIPSEAMAEDIANLVGTVAPVAGSGPIVIIASVKQAARLRLMPLNPYPVLSSAALSDKVVMSVAGNALASIVDPLPRFELSSAATLHFDDSSPRQIDDTAVAATVKNMFQIDAVAARVTFDCAWGLRGSGAVAWLQSVLW